MPNNKNIDTFFCYLDTVVCENWQCKNLSTLYGHLRIHHPTIIDSNKIELIEMINSLSKQIHILQNKQQNTQNNLQNVLQNNTMNSTQIGNNIQNVQQQNNIQILHLGSSLDDLADYNEFRLNVDERLAKLFNHSIYDSKTFVNIVAQALYTNDKRQCYMKVSDASRNKFVRKENGKKQKDDGTVLMMDITPICNKLAFEEKQLRDQSSNWNKDKTNDTYNSIMITDQKRKKFITDLKNTLPSVPLQLQNQANIFAEFYDNQNVKTNEFLNLSSDDKDNLIKQLEVFCFDEKDFLEFFDKELNSGCLEILSGPEMICDNVIHSVNKNKIKLIWNDSYQCFILKKNTITLMFTKSLKDLVNQVEFALFNWVTTVFPKNIELQKKLSFRGVMEIDKYFVQAIKNCCLEKESIETQLKFKLQAKEIHIRKLEENIIALKQQLQLSHSQNTFDIQQKFEEICISEDEDDNKESLNV